jgi:hypothetical protein
MPSELEPPEPLAEAVETLPADRSEATVWYGAMETILIFQEVWR